MVSISIYLEIMMLELFVCISALYLSINHSSKETLKEIQLQYLNINDSFYM